jgi:hypothetical protein
MVLATDDTISTSVPHEKYFPGSQVLHDKCVAALIADFERADGSVGFTAKGKAKEFIGVGIDQTSPGRIVLDMRATANNIVKKHGFEDAHHAHAPGTSGTDWHRTVRNRLRQRRRPCCSRPHCLSLSHRQLALAVSWYLAHHWLPCRCPVSHEPHAWQEALACVL